MTLSDKLVVMNGGQIEQIGTPADVYRRPGDPLRRDLHRLAADEHPAGPGRGPGPRLRRRADASPSPTCARGSRPGPPVEVGLRPEDVQAGATRRQHARPSSVDFVEELGATQLFHGKVAGAEFVVQASTGQIPAETRSADPRRRPRQRPPVRPADHEAARPAGSAPQALELRRGSRCPSRYGLHPGSPRRYPLEAGRTRHDDDQDRRAGARDPGCRAGGATGRRGTLREGGSRPGGARAHRRDAGLYRAHWMHDDAPLMYAFNTGVGLFKDQRVLIVRHGGLPAQDRLRPRHRDRRAVCRRT